MVYIATILYNTGTGTFDSRGQPLDVEMLDILRDTDTPILFSSLPG